MEPKAMLSESGDNGCIVYRLFFCCSFVILDNSIETSGCMKGTDTQKIILNLQIMESSYDIIACKYILLASNCSL